MLLGAFDVTQGETRTPKVQSNVLSYAKHPLFLVSDSKLNLKTSTQIFS